MRWFKRYPSPMLLQCAKISWEECFSTDQKTVPRQTGVWDIPGFRNHLYKIITITRGGRRRLAQLTFREIRVVRVMKTTNKYHILIMPKRWTKSTITSRMPFHKYHLVEIQITFSLNSLSRHGLRLSSSSSSLWIITFKGPVRLS